MDTTKVAIIGSGNIGTDLMIKIKRLSASLEVAAFVGIDPSSPGLARAERLGITAIPTGVDGMRRLPRYDEVEIVLDATSAQAHHHNAAVLADDGKRIVDLTPAAIGPYVVPPVNLHEHLTASNVNMVTCGGQATIPIVAGIAAVTPVAYAEIVASIASRSAGPGTRANIDEFTQTTSAAIEQVGGAERGKAIIILNPADPPLIMRDTVHTLVGDADHDKIRASVEEMVARVAAYVPGYSLKQEIQFQPVREADVATLLHPSPPGGRAPVTHQVSVYLKVEGAAHYLPAYAGNLDIMTSAAVQVAESMAAAQILVRSTDGSPA